jgi:hypothetical protein
LGARDYRCSPPRFDGDSEIHSGSSLRCAQGLAPRAPSLTFAPRLREFPNPRRILRRIAGWASNNVRRQIEGRPKMGERMGKLFFSMFFSACCVRVLAEGGGTSMGQQARQSRDFEDFAPHSNLSLAIALLLETVGQFSPIDHHHRVAKSSIRSPVSGSHPVIPVRAGSLRADPHGHAASSSSELVSATPICRVITSSAYIRRRV